MRFASLGSGSLGNALVVESNGTRVLLDCGFSVASATARLKRLGLEPGQLDAIIVTHEHDDHIGGVARLAQRFDIPVWLSHGTLRGFESKFAGVRVSAVENYAAFSVGSLRIEPYPVPHDAREPAQYVLSNGAVRLGVLTDAGDSTRHIEQMLSGCEALLLECNHDSEMLAKSSYPQRVKDRIASRVGHLENEAAAKLLASLDTRRLQHIVAAHLSRQNNTPGLARSALCGALGCAPDWIGIADQDSGFDWLEIS
ncbi:MAG: MBL fold metallo-hydrolase [Candidatus Binataceae bacterium]